jgi:hypothetical protein
MIKKLSSIKKKTTHKPIINRGNLGYFVKLAKHTNLIEIYKKKYKNNFSIILLLKIKLIKKLL